MASQEDPSTSGHSTLGCSSMFPPTLLPTAHGLPGPPSPPCGLAAPLPIRHTGHAAHAHHAAKNSDVARSPSSHELPLPRLFSVSEIEPANSTPHKQPVSQPPTAPASALPAWDLLSPGTAQRKPTQCSVTPFGAQSVQQQLAHSQATSSITASPPFMQASFMSRVP